MNPIRKSGLYAVELRRQAEIEQKKAGEPPKNIELFSLGSKRNLNTELQVHQIELEMQNLELLQTQAELEVSRERYIELYDSAPVGYLTISENGLILEANLTFVSLFGVTKNTLLKHPLSLFIFRADQDSFYLWLKRLVRSGVSQPIELRIVKKNGTPFWVQIEATLAQNANGAIIVRAAISNINDRKLAEAAMEER